ncbi:MAG: pilus assembly PilX family protein [Acidiferrobacteraceae bacterium]
MSVRRQRGFLLIAAIVLVVILSFFALVITDLYVGDTRSSIDHLSSSQALFLAESGLERATRALLSPTVLTPSSPDNRQSCAAINTNLTGVAQGAGVFSVTGGTPFYSGDTTNSAMTINGPLSATATVIPLANTASLTDYAPSGRVMIGQEEIDYSAISPSASVCGTAPCLIGVIRGVDGTAAVTHVSGSPVGQYQCVLQSQGGVPALTNARGLRTLTQGVELQEAWAVGSESQSWAQGSGVVTALRFGGNAWADVSSSFSLVTRNSLNAITCVNYADCWAVGSADLLRTIYGGGPTPVATALHWNGSRWQNFSGSFPLQGQDIDSVWCNGHDDCWMVGSYTMYPGSFKKHCNCWALVHMSWSGTTPVWTSYQPKSLRPSLPNGQWDRYSIDGVACMNANECLAVGSYTQNFPLILAWNGSYWTMLAAPGWMGGQDLDGITCTTSSCWVVGSTATGQALVAGWTPPNNWTSYPVANASDVENVTCTGVNDCWAVGSWDGPYAVYGETTLLHWNGATWSNVTSQLPPSIVGNRYDLDGIACANADDCWAVGSLWSPYFGGSGMAMVHWNGIQWTDFSASMPNGNDVEGIALTGPHARPRSAWQEVFP